MRDILQEAIDALRAAGKEDEARAVEELRRAYLAAGENLSQRAPTWTEREFRDAFETFAKGQELPVDRGMVYGDKIARKCWYAWYAASRWTAKQLGLP